MKRKKLPEELVKHVLTEWDTGKYKSKAVLAKALKLDRYQVYNILYSHGRHPRKHIRPVTQKCSSLQYLLGEKEIELGERKVRGFNYSVFEINMLKEFIQEFPTHIPKNKLEQLARQINRDIDSVYRKIRKIKNGY